MKKLYPKSQQQQQQQQGVGAAALPPLGRTQLHYRRTEEDDDGNDSGVSQAGPSGSGRAAVCKASIFSLAMSTGGNVVASGGADHIVSV